MVQRTVIAPGRAVEPNCPNGKTGLRMASLLRLTSRAASRAAVSLRSYLGGFVRGHGAQYRADFVRRIGHSLGHNPTTSDFGPCFLAYRAALRFCAVCRPSRRCRTRLTADTSLLLARRCSNLPAMPPNDPVPDAVQRPRSLERAAQPAWHTLLTSARTAR